MKQTTIAVILLVFCIGLRFLVDVFDQSKNVELPTIENVSLGSILESNSELFIERQIVEIKTDSILQISKSDIKITQTGNGIFKYKVTSNEENDFSTIYDNLNLLLEENPQGISLYNKEMVSTQIKSNYDDIAFNNFGNDVYNQISTTSSLDMTTLGENILVDDMGLHAINIFNNINMERFEVTDSISLNVNPGIRFLKLRPDTDSTDVMITSETHLNSGIKRADTISYNYKNNVLNEIISTQIFRNKYKIRQVITR